MEKYTSVNLSMNKDGYIVDTKFSDLEETLERTFLTRVKKFIIREIPSYRSETFEDDVILFVFNELEIAKKLKENIPLRIKIYGE